MPANVAIVQEHVFMDHNLSLVDSNYERRVRINSFRPARKNVACYAKLVKATPHIADLL
jgi:hypothetical protein